MDTIAHLIAFAVLNLLMICFGYIVIGKKAIVAGWIMLAAGVLLVGILFTNELPLLRMLAIIATTFTGMKVIAVAESYKPKPLTLSFKQWLVYAIGWVGMRAEPFEKLGGPVVPGGRAMIKSGAIRVAAGAILIFIARYIAHLHIDNAFVHTVVTALLLVAFSLIFHFGLLAISAGTWRLSGVNTYLLFRQPARSLSLTELWSKRWNIAFSEMTSVAVFRPVRKTIGPAAALLVSFIFSGLLHELALSLPVNAGYGLPTLYFLLQGILVLIEKVLIAKHITILQNKSIARLWVFFWLIVPMPLLFHPAFVKGILWPMAGLVHP